MHATETGQHIKAMRRRGRETLAKANKARRAGYELALPEAHEEAFRLEEEAALTLKEAEDLISLARLEDLHLWTMEKKSQSARSMKIWKYWMASWRDGSGVHNEYIGSQKRLSHSDALAKAIKKKREFLGLNKPSKD
jgi:hypothetical protein